MSEILEIDGSYLEGGGQILRLALSLSCILRRPIRVTRIRANRPKPGLSQQHLHGLNLLKEVTNARVSGNFLSSTEVEFHPSDIKAGVYAVNTPTAASITLILQAALPVLIFGNALSHLDLVGGTNVQMAPQIDYTVDVLLPNLEKFGVSFKCDSLKRGFYPRGGGRCRMIIPPVKSIHAVNNSSFGVPVEIIGRCFISGTLPPNLAKSMKLAAEEELRGLQQVKIKIDAFKEDPNMGKDNGSAVILRGVSSEGCVVGASTLGERRVNASALGKTAAKELRDYLMRSICVDQYAQDQIILYMALAVGVSSIQTCALTKHTSTAIHIAELMTGAKFQVDNTAATSGHIILTCEGIGHTNQF